MPEGSQKKDNPKPCHTELTRSACFLIPKLQTLRCLPPEQCLAWSACAVAPGPQCRRPARRAADTQGQGRWRGHVPSGCRTRGRGTMQVRTCCLWGSQGWNQCGLHKGTPKPKSTERAEAVSWDLGHPAVCCWTLFPTGQNALPPPFLQGPALPTSRPVPAPRIQCYRRVLTCMPASLHQSDSS